MTNDEISTEHGARDFYPVETMGQLGATNIMAISGGRCAVRPNGLILPVSSGYRVEIHLAADDTYTVRRVMVRGSKRFVKGEVAGVYCDQLGDVAYVASCFRSYPKPEDWGAI